MSDTPRCQTPFRASLHQLDAAALDEFGGVGAWGGEDVARSMNDRLRQRAIRPQILVRLEHVVRQDSNLDCVRRRETRPCQTPDPRASRIEARLRHDINLTDELGRICTCGTDPAVDAAQGADAAGLDERTREQNEDVPRPA